MGPALQQPRTQETVESLRVGPGRTVRGMDAAAELTGMYLQRVPPPHPGPTPHVETPSHDPLLLLPLLLLLISKQSRPQAARNTHRCRSSCFSVATQRRLTSSGCLPCRSIACT